MFGGENRAGNGFIKVDPDLILWVLTLIETKGRCSNTFQWSAVRRALSLSGSHDFFPY